MSHKRDVPRLLSLWTQARRPLQAPIEANDFFVALMIKRKRTTVKMPYNALNRHGKRLESLSSPQVHEFLQRAFARLLYCLYNTMRIGTRGIHELRVTTCKGSRKLAWEETFGKDSRQY